MGLEPDPKCNTFQLKGQLGNPHGIVPLDPSIPAPLQITPQDPLQEVEVQTKIITET